MTKFGYNILERRCTACGKYKPLLGGVTQPRFMCADCKPKKKK